MRPNTHNTTETGVEADELREKAHSYPVDRVEIVGREHLSANFACPQCDRELVPRPGNSWICWQCDNVIYVDGDER